MATKFTWALGSNSNLYLPHAIAGYPYLYYPYVSLAGTGSVWPQVEPSIYTTSAVNAGSFAYQGVHQLTDG